MSRITDPLLRGPVYRQVMAVLAAKPDVPLFDHPHTIGPVPAAWEPDALARELYVQARTATGWAYRAAAMRFVARADLHCFDHAAPIGPFEAPFSTLEMAAAYRRYCARPGTLTGRPMFDHPYPLLPGNADGAQEWELSGRALVGPRLGRLTRSELREARSWIADCWESSEVNPERLSRSEVESAIARHYSGGLPEFIRNTNGA